MLLDPMCGSTDGWNDICVRYLKVILKSVLAASLFTDGEIITQRTGGVCAVLQ